MRLFLAVWPPADIVASLAALPRPETAELRWTTPDQWHVTLRFLGPTEVVPVETALATVATAHAVAALGPAVGRFGHRILHVPVAGLDTIASAVAAATADLGRPPEDRPFAGHLTLGRVAKGAGVDLRRFAGAAIDGHWDVTDICLVESRLSPAGARYEVVQRFPLRGWVTP